MNRRILSALLLALTLPLAAFSGTVHVIFNAEISNQDPLTVKRITVQPISAYGVNSSNTVTGDIITRQLNSSGSTTVSNLLNGRSYRVSYYGNMTPWGTNWVTVVTNSFATNVIGLVNASDYVDVPTVIDGTSSAYSQAQANALFIATSNGIVQNVSGGSSTNISLYASNTLVYTLNQNQRIITGGATGTNGTYIRIATSPTSIYSNGVYRLIDEAYDDVDCPDGIITNTSGALIACKSGSWSPALTVYMPTNQPNTNAELYILGGLTPGYQTTTNDFFVAPWGSDLFWRAGDPTRPMRTLSNAIAYHRVNNNIYVAPGHFTNSQAFNVRSSSIIGSGRGQTFIHTAGSEISISLLGTNCLLRDFSSEMPINIGNPSEGGTAAGGATNTILKNLEVRGQTDGVITFIWDGVYAENCLFSSYFDSFTDQQGFSAPSRSNFLATLKNCDLISIFKSGVSTVVRGLVVGNSRIIMDGGSITVSNGTAFNACVYGDYNYELGSGAILSNVRLSFYSTNSARSYAVQGESPGGGSSNLNVTVYGMLINGGDTTNTTIIQAESDARLLTNVISVKYPTNISGTRVAFSFTNDFIYRVLSTNAGFQFLAPANVSSTNFQICLYFVTNSGASTIPMIAPSNVYTNGGGAWNVTNGGVTMVYFYNHFGVLTNAESKPVR